MVMSEQEIRLDIFNRYFGHIMVSDKTALIEACKISEFIYQFTNGSFESVVADEWNKKAVILNAPVAVNCPDGEKLVQRIIDAVAAFQASGPVSK